MKPTESSTSPTHLRPVSTTLQALSRHNHSKPQPKRRPVVVQEMARFWMKDDTRGIRSTSRILPGRSCRLLGDECTSGRVG